MSARHWLQSEDQALIDARLAAAKNITDTWLAERLAKRMDRTRQSVYVRLRKLHPAIAAARAEIERIEGLPPVRARRGVVASPNNRRRRPCMCCGREFISEGPHNRLCHKCRAADISPYAPGGA